MIVQDFTLDKYGWYVKVYYTTAFYAFEDIINDLYSLGYDDEKVEEIIEELKEYKENEGYTFTNVYASRSLIIIGPTTSADDFQDTFDHEKGHLAMHICIAEDIDPFSEEFQYLNGLIGKQMFRAGKMFLCDHCRNELLEKE